MQKFCYSWIISLFLFTGLVNAACQFSQGRGDVSITPSALSLSNGEIGYATITVKNHLLLNDLTVYVNNRQVGTVGGNGQQSFSVSVDAPPWGSGSGQIYKQIDVMAYAENKCWDNQLGIQLSYSPGQAEIAAQQAALLAQQEAQRNALLTQQVNNQKETGGQQTVILVIIGILVLVAIVVGVTYLSRQKAKK